MKEALKEIESLFGTTAKGNTVYFNDINYTPIPLPVANAVKAIMDDHPDVGYQLGLYSVKLFDKNVRPMTGTINLNNSLKKKITSKRDNEVKSSAIGDIKDDYCLGKIKDNEAIERLTQNGKGKRDAKKIVDKWKGEGVIKSSRKLSITSSVNTTEDLYNVLTDYDTDVEFDNGKIIWDDQYIYVDNGQVITDGKGWTDSCSVEEYLDMLDDNYKIVSRRLPLTSSNELTYCGYKIDRSTPWVIFKNDFTNFTMDIYGCYGTKEEAMKAYRENSLDKVRNNVIYEIDDARGNELLEDRSSGYFEAQVSSRKPLKSSLSEFFPVSEEEAKDIDELADTFTDRSELRSVLEDYFHIYDDYASLDIQDFDRCLADYFDSTTNQTEQS